MKKYKNKTAIVTGGASGLGRALCEMLAEYGADVVAADINIEGAMGTAKQIENAGGRCTSAELDVADETQVRALVKRTAAEKGRLDYMFNNAGIGVGGEAHNISIAQWKRIVDINQWGVVYGTLAAYRIMIGQGHGHIVNIASAAGLVPFALLLPYVTTKHAVVGFSAGLRAEAAGLGVKVSVACPTVVDTPFIEKVDCAQTDMDRIMSVTSKQVHKTRLDAKDCARLILRKVARNRGFISVQMISKLVWWINRLHPGVMETQNKKAMKKFRRSI